MPIYEYNCLQCNKRFEELVRTKADEMNMACNTCGSQQIERAVSVCGFSSKDSHGHVTASSHSGNNCSDCHSHCCENCH